MDDNSERRVFGGVTSFCIKLFRYLQKQFRMLVRFQPLAYVNVAKWYTQKIQNLSQFNKYLFLFV